jgi:DNA transformation protein
LNCCQVRAALEGRAPAAALLLGGQGGLLFNRHRLVRKDSFKDFVIDQLDGLEGVTCRAMFGGHGLYCGTSFFGIVYKERLFFRTTEATRLEYERRGMQPFRPNPNQALQRYYEVPAEVLEDRLMLVEWARRALGAGGQG